MDLLILLAIASPVAALLLITWALLRASALDTERYEQPRPYRGGRIYGAPDVRPLVVDQDGTVLIGVREQESTSDKAIGRHLRRRGERRVE